MNRRGFLKKISGGVVGAVGLAIGIQTEPSRLWGERALAAREGDIEHYRFLCRRLEHEYKKHTHCLGGGPAAPPGPFVVRKVEQGHMRAHCVCDLEQMKLEEDPVELDYIDWR